MSERVHELKTWPSAFQAVADGAKRHELRVNDRDFATGDILKLREFEPGKSTAFAYTKRVQHCRVTYITHGGQWGLPPTLCVMSIELIGGVEHDPKY